MRRLLDICLAAGTLVCLGLLYGSVVPGRLNGVMLLAVVIGLFAVPIGASVGIGLLLNRTTRRMLHETTQAHPVRCYLLVGVPAVTLALLAFHVPERVAFRLWRGGFDAALADFRRGEPVEGRSIGPFTIVKAYRDGAGGAYFAVYQGTDGIGPDTLSCGYCVEPAANTSPLGAKYWAPRSVGGGWHRFVVSDDWH